MDTLTRPPQPQTKPSVLDELRTWPARRWWTAAATTLATVVITAIPTAMIPTPLFTREIPTTVWAWPVLVVTSVLAGLVAATYVARRDPDEGGERGRAHPLRAVGQLHRLEQGQPRARGR